jgi:dihydropteroate synthase
LNPKDTAFYPKKTLQLKGSLMDLSRPKVMGILNITPDSFFDGGVNNSAALALKKVNQMLIDGVDIIDVGGYSTKPNAAEVSVEEELVRVIPVIDCLKREHPDVIVSVDTFRSKVAYRAINAGASIVNDVSGGNLDSQMFATVAGLQVPYVLMHMRGTPATMQKLTNYQHVVVDVAKELVMKLNLLRQLGVNDVIIDPGFGFAKTIAHNYEMLKNLSYFEVLECALLVGISRKSMVYKALGSGPESGLNGTTALHMAALMQGASILRVHDVKEAKEVVTLFNKMQN